VVARAHQTLISERHRHMLRLRTTLREFFPAALEAFDDLTAPDGLDLLGRAPDPASATRLTPAKVTAVLPRARHRTPQDKAAAITLVLRAWQRSPAPRQEDNRAGTLRPQRPAHRRPAPAGDLRPDRLTQSPHLQPWPPTPPSARYTSMRQVTTRNPATGKPGPAVRYRHSPAPDQTAPG